MYVKKLIEIDIKRDALISCGLRKRSADSEPNLQGFSPLHIASASGKLELVRVLLSVGQKRDVCFLKDKDGLIPLHSAAQRGRIKSWFPLSLNLSTNKGLFLRPLFMFQVEVTELLLQEINNRNTSWGIVNQENREGNTILHLQHLGNSFRQIVEMLIGDEAIIYGSVDVNKQNRSWLTPKDVLDVLIETEGGSVSEMHRIVQIFQTAEARNAIEKRKNLKPIDPSRNPLRMIKSDWDWSSSSHGKEFTFVIKKPFMNLRK
ncbi:PREDICTED: serine/threonine-protein phosphatase 6 regulatory ankyrin repeat subunit A-like [Camelina sativa]|uniref:Serine/threonine-protein phosphatase 6 regulatory ankyrin repeat subunit A-like n=1 Tax=Camelina sativa TaxID=90675 RepID=A0ABM0ZAY7_CAMSA|nr:PREDICTED: serine/threonine-protein phosphatase 6 regulatory ankyrin repeat subunit A-like [Camelina sativa]